MGSFSDATYVQSIHKFIQHMAQQLWLTVATAMLMWHLSSLLSRPTNNSTRKPKGRNKDGIKSGDLRPDHVLCFHLWILHCNEDAYLDNIGAVLHNNRC